MRRRKLTRFLNAKVTLTFQVEGPVTSEEVQGMTIENLSCVKLMSNGHEVDAKLVGNETTNVSILEPEEEFQ